MRLSLCGLKKMLAIALAGSTIVMSGCASVRAGNQSKEQNHTKSEYSGEITVWSWNNELITSGIIDQFHEEYPDVYVNLVTIPNDNNSYSKKLIATLRSGVCAPDIYLAESAVVRKLCNQKFYENLSTEQYQAEELAKGMMPYTVELGRNDEDGSIRALTWQAAPGGFFYRRSLAKEYFGTDDPQKIQSMMSTMDEFMAMGETIKEKSNGSVSLLANFSELFYVFLANREHGWCEDGKLVIDDALYDYIKIAKQIRDNGYDCNAKQWTPAWSKAQADGSVFGFVLPTWGLSNVLQGNAPDTKGDWAFVRMPASYYWGGSWIGMYNGSRNKDLSWLFIKYITSDESFMKQYALNTGDYVNNVNTANEISASEEGNNAFLNGQNVYKEYTELVKDVDGSIITEYDEVINNIWSSALEKYIDGEYDQDEMIQKFKQEVLERTGLK